MQSISARMNNSAGCLPDMSSEASPNDQEIKFPTRFSALLTDESARVFAPETYAVGAVICVSAGAILFWMGIFSAL